jgi:hypothetical protein
MRLLRQGKIFPRRGFDVYRSYRDFRHFWALGFATLCKKSSLLFLRARTKKALAFFVTNSQYLP